MYYVIDEDKRTVKSMQTMDHSACLLCNDSKGTGTLNSVHSRVVEQGYHNRNNKYIEIRLLPDYLLMQHVKEYLLQYTF